MASLLLAYLIESCTVERRTGIDENSEPTYAEPETAKCRYRSKSRRVTGPKGETIYSSAVFGIDRLLKAGDRITYGGRAYDVLEAGMVPGIDTRHKEYEAVV